jgi:hypothetical protein
MNPSSEAIQAIRQRVSDWSATDADIAESLNSETEPNPEPQQDVPRRLTKMGVLSLLSTENQVKVLNYPNLDLVYRSFDAQDHESCVSWVQALYLTGNISQVEAGMCIAHITATEPDPKYSATVPAPTLWLGRLVDAWDVQSARESE